MVNTDHKTRGVVRGGHARGRRTAQSAFLGVLFMYFLALAVTLPGLSPGARFFPIIILAASTVFFLLKALSTAYPWAERHLEPDISMFGPGGGDTRPTVPRGGEPDASAPGEKGRGVIVPWLWVVGAVAAMYAFGFLVGTAVSIFVYARFISRDSWQVAALSAALTVLFAYLVFVRAMHIDLDFGLLTNLFASS